MVMFKNLSATERRMIFVNFRILSSKKYTATLKTIEESEEQLETKLGLISDRRKIH